MSLFSQRPRKGSLKSTAEVPLDRALQRLQQPLPAVESPQRELLAIGNGAESIGFGERLQQWWLPMLLSLLGVAFYTAGPVPTSNEWAYLALLKKAWNPEWIAGDWTLAEPNVRHYTFNLLFGWPTKFLPLEVFGWIGRIGCWVLTLWTLFRIGERLGLRAGTVSIAVLLWLSIGQSLVAGEWIFGGFEAKTVAYVLLFLAIDGFLRDRPLRSALVLGACFSIHPAVGLWGGVGMLVPAVWNLGLSWKLLRTGVVVVIAALPGVIPVLWHGAPVPAEELRFQVLVRLPYHLDPLIWDRSLMLILVAMTVLLVTVGFTQPDRRVKQLLIALPVALLLMFCLGVLARLAGSWGFVLLMPFRLFPLLVPLLFLMLLVGGLRRDVPFPLRGWQVVLVIVSLVCLPNPLLRTVDRAWAQHTAWTKPADEIQQAFQWVQQNTPADAVLISPPWRDDALLLSERPQVSVWAICPQPHMTEWRERSEALRGDDWRQTAQESWLVKMKAGYQQLDLPAIADVRKKYGGDYLLSSQHYALPVVFTAGEWHVYHLPDDAAL